ncbi:MAG: hypothetical protein P8Q14_02970 [Vicingaceae bacterium]|nr:hypothetical protein [Vicingaceae bacterium]
MASIGMELEESKIKLKTKDRDVFFKKEFSKLKIKVALNWFELVALFLVTFFGVIKVTFILKMSSITLSVIIAIILSVSVVLLFSYFRNYQLKITRFDKEHIYKKISADLIEKSKCDS